MHSFQNIYIYIYLGTTVYNAEAAGVNWVAGVL